MPASRTGAATAGGPTASAPADTMTIAEKIMARAAGRPRVASGEYVDCRLDGVMAYESFVDTHEHLIDAGLPDGIPKVWNPKRLYLMVEHVQPATSVRQAERAKKLRELVPRYRIEHFSDVTCGICHQMMVDRAHALPGQLLVGSDSHSVMWGALNCASTGIGEMDLAYAVTFGELWFMVPATIRLELTGSPPPWPVAKDVMLALAGRHGADFALYRALEVTGPGASALSLDGRFTIADHGIEVGAKFAIFEHDDRTREFLDGRAEEEFEPVAPGPAASYEQTLTVDLSELGPQVAAPHSFDNVHPVDDLRGIRFDQACIGSCANGRFEDIEVTARILRGRRVHPGVRLLVSPASWEVWKRCAEAGLPQTIVEAGGQFLDPGCGICIPARAYLAPGEVCLSATTRNYQGRMGSPDASIYLANPATVAWSSVVGAIADPREVLGT